MEKAEARISLDVISPESMLVHAKVDCVFLPGTVGRFEVLKGHAPLISSLEKGDIVYRTGGKEERIGISGGFAEVCDDHVTACVEV